MSTKPAPNDQTKPLVTITGLARAMQDNGFDSDTVTVYLTGKDRDRDLSKFMEALWNE